MSQSQPQADNSAFYAEHRAEQKRCRQDFWYFVTVVLGGVLEDPKRDIYGQMHRELCEWDRQTRNKAPNRRRLILLPRGGLKSTWMNVGVALHEMILSHGVGSNQEERCIGICSSKKDGAQSHLSAIRWHMEENQRFRSRFPNLCWNNPDEEAPTWTKAELTVKGRKKQNHVPTFKAFSIDSLPTGDHYHRIICDDAITGDNSGTSDAIRQTNEKMGLLTPLLITPAYPMDNIGTIYNHGDFHAFNRDLIENQLERGVTPRMAMFYREAAEWDGQKLSNPVYPERLPLTVLEHLRDTDPDTFWSQYMLRPQNASPDCFDKKDFRTYTSESLEKAGKLAKIMFCDPSRSVSKTSDFYACAVLGVSRDKNLYLLDGFKERLSPPQLAERLSALHSKWKPDRSLVEKNGLNDWLREGLKANGFTRFEAAQSKGDKNERIKLIHTFVKRHRLFYSAAPQMKTAPNGKQYNLVDAFVAEALGYPNGEHDDFLDALQGAIRYSGVKISERDNTTEVERVARIERRQMPPPKPQKRTDNTFGAYGADW